MTAPLFRLVAVPPAIDEWAQALLQEGELALLPDEGGLDAVLSVARTLSLASVPVVAEADERAVIRYASGFPLVWIAAAFTEQARTWAHDRGPMTLLVEAEGALPEPERRRIERFVALLGRQSD
ncbi:MAG TPA: hypothetical protein VHX88_07790 [Solirubrobacteraceae bacterium]|jgi:hypothetical protein|nr:hypothetical protein [Solirubrobacteraceae bacterium]